MYTERIVCGISSVNMLKSRLVINKSVNHNCYDASFANASGYAEPSVHTHVGHAGVEGINLGRVILVCTGASIPIVCGLLFRGKGKDQLCQVNWAISLGLDHIVRHGCTAEICGLGIRFGLTQGTQRVSSTPPIMQVLTCDYTSCHCITKTVFGHQECFATAF